MPETLGSIPARGTKKSMLKNQEVNRLDEGPVLKTGGDNNRLWVRVPRLPLMSFENIGD